MNADDTVSDAKKGLLYPTTICSCRKFAFPHTEQLNSFYEAFIQYDAAFTAPSQTTAENFLPRVANFFQYFDALMFPSHIFLRLSVRPLKISWASLRKEHGRL